MKKLISIILLLCCVLSSCQSNITNEDIAANLDSYEVLYSGETNSGDTEMEYVSTVTTGVEGILTSDWVINDNKYYFVTKRRDNRGLNGVEMITYVDLETGDSHIICQDPLCEHQEGGNCKYAEFQDMFFIAPGIFYSTRVKDPDGVTQKKVAIQICKIDLNKDTVEEVYVTSTFFTTVIGIDAGRLYFYERISETNNKETKDKYHYFCLDTATGKVEDLGYIDEQFMTELSYIHQLADGNVYYVSRLGKLMKTDLLFKEKTEIFDLEEDSLNNFFYDTNTGEVYFSAVNQAANTGAIYVYSENKVQKLQLPNENIYSFTLTNSKIYYSTYNPVYYGISATAYYLKKDPEDCKVYDYSGGKVYVTDRYNPMEAELVYDCAGEYVICLAYVKNYSVFGDYIYFNEDEIARETIDGVEYTYFDSAFNVNKIRVNLTTGEMKRIMFE